MKYVFFLSVTCFALAPMMASGAVAPASQSGIYAKLCGSGRIVFIPLQENGEDPEQPRHFTGACHAVHNDEQDDGSGEDYD